MVFRKRRRESEEAFALYYASDVHGSDQCWRKFLGAGRFYGVNALIMGGDLTGKAIVPIAARRRRRVHGATFLGETRSGRGADAARPSWPRPSATTACTRGSRARTRSRGTAPTPRPAAELFERVMLDELRRWIDLADERMPPHGIDVYVMAGNDDPWSCDAVLESADARLSLRRPRVTEVGGHEMISCSYANPTPWDSPRELDEDALYARIKGLADQLEHPETAIFNLHVPPYDSGLDTAYEIDDQLRIVVRERQAARDPGRLDRGAPDHRGVPAPARAARAHPRVARRGARSGGRSRSTPDPSTPAGRIHGVTVKLAERSRAQSPVHDRIEEARRTWPNSRHPTRSAPAVTDSGLFVRNATGPRARHVASARASIAQLHPGASDPDARGGALRVRSRSSRAANPYLALLHRAPDDALVLLRVRAAHRR